MTWRKDVKSRKAKGWGGRELVSNLYRGRSIKKRKVNNQQRTVLKTKIAIMTVTTFVLGVSVGLYLAAAFIGPAILEAAK